ncbi:alpha/beta hydrolase fold protein [Halosimplex carlsbadense 2-9-1]|uniref:Alpha/beta hydrolase fold protein n=1 Tax=Halosimplex carlsbadense 2-9-1 TaxID=797114 RepID=M0CBP2_9EURY|nr:alpha/beta hydrolase [Halosimplex carlsbadense]ELZ20650.1 alpha/beta hydrolase fold protein [Halosimplex carlsbadense 2-9-1]
MKLRTVVGATLGAVGAAVAANRVLGRQVGELGPPLAGDSGTYRWRGFDVAYTEAGDPDDQDLVLLHGINAAATSNEWRMVFETLAEDYHVIAPDLPGFGRSDRPPLTYSASLYTTFVRDFLTDTSDDAVVVASSLTGAYAADAARDVDVSRLVLVCPTADTVPGRRVWLRSLIRAPVVGQAIYNGIASERSIRYFHDDHGYHDTAKLNTETVRYEWESAHQPGARFAPASFISGHLDPDVDLTALLGDLDVPVTLVWGTETDMPPLSTGRELAEAADVELVSIGDSELLPHVEHPAEFLDVVRGEPVESSA